MTHAQDCGRCPGPARCFALSLKALPGTGYVNLSSSTGLAFHGSAGQNQTSNLAILLFQKIRDVSIVACVPKPVRTYRRMVLIDHLNFSAGSGGQRSVGIQQVPRAAMQDVEMPPILNSAQEARIRHKTPPVTLCESPGYHRVITSPWKA
jgi:hypothetical protein